MLEELVSGVVLHKDGGEVVACSAVGRDRRELLFWDALLQTPSSLVVQ